MDVSQDKTPFHRLLSRRAGFFAALTLFFAAPALFAPAASASGPEPGKVLMIYVDGLRPDTVDEMVREGRLPVIKKLFYDGGARFENFFTVFPSNTVIANAAFMTGKWPSNNGLKTQAFFRRFETRSRPWYKKMWARRAHPFHTNLLANPHLIRPLLRENKIRTLYNYLGEGYHSALVPIMPYPAPMAWPHVAANAVNNPLLVTEEAAKKLDLVNATYASDYMPPDTKAKIFLVWFPSLDEAQHYAPDGQFGEVRAKMEEIDTWLGRFHEHMMHDGQKVYTLLFSDHGALGGKNGVYNQRYYLGRDFFYEKLKMNVIGPDYSVSHAGTDKSAFAYVDNMGRGQAHIYLPVSGADSGDWSRPNTFHELTHYGLGPNRQPVNLVEALTGIDAGKENKFPEVTVPNPVDVLFVKVSPALIYVRKGEKEALIEISRDAAGEELYRYVPVKNFAQAADGSLSFEETRANDPFGYLTDPAFAAGDEAGANAFLEKPLSAREWLEATYRTAYPDAVVLAAKLFSWNPRLEHLARAQDPDIVLSASPGWNFRFEDIPSADHGYIARESLRSTLMIHGPGVRAGAIESPHRILEVAPTIFEMIGYRGETDFDEKPIREIYGA